MCGFSPLCLHLSECNRSIASMQLWCTGEHSKAFSVYTRQCHRSIIAWMQLWCTWQFHTLSGMHQMHSGENQKHFQIAKLHMSIWAIQGAQIKNTNTNKSYYKQYIVIPLFKDVKPRESKKLLVYRFWLLVLCPNMITMSNCTALLNWLSDVFVCLTHFHLCKTPSQFLSYCLWQCKRNIRKFTVKIMTLFPKALLWTYTTQGKAFFHLIINIFAILAASATLPWKTSFKNKNKKQQQKLTCNKNKQAAKQNKLNQNGQMWRYHLRREDVSLQLSRGSWETDCFYLLIFQLNNLRGRCVPTALPREEGHGLQDAQWHCQPLLWLHLPVKCGVRQKVRMLFCIICELHSKMPKYTHRHCNEFVDSWQLDTVAGSWSSWEVRWGTTSRTWWTPSRSSARAPRGRWARRRRWSRRLRGWQRRLNLLFP